MFLSKLFVLMEEALKMGLLFYSSELLLFLDLNTHFYLVTNQRTH